MDRPHLFGGQRLPDVDTFDFGGKQKVLYGEVQQHLGGQVLTTIIPRNIRLTEAPSHGKPIMLYDLRSSGATAYLELTKEVLAHG